MTRQRVSFSRRSLLLGAFAGVLDPLSVAGAVTADRFPSRPVRLVVPLPPGGPTDSVARLIAQALQERWDEPVSTDHKPGAGTAIGIDFVAKSTPDGYTIGIVDASFTVNPSLFRDLPYDTLKDLSGITQIANLQLALVARPDAPFDTLPQLIAYAKQQPEKLSYGTPGAGSLTHLSAELLQREAGFTMLRVPYTGSPSAQTELVDGRIDLMVDPLLSVLPFVSSGRMKMIATLGRERVPAHDFPTVAETIPGFHVSAPVGLVAPHATPRAVIDKIQLDMAEVLRDPKLRQRIEDQGMTIATSTPARFDTLIAADMKRWAKVVEDAGITLD